MSDPQAHPPVAARPFRPLASLLVRRAIAVAIVCTLLAAGIQAVISAREEQSAFDAALQRVAATQVALLAVALWDIEPEAIRRQLAHVAAQPEVAYVRLEERTGHAFAAGDEARRGESAARRVAIPYPDGREGTLGELELIPDYAALYRRIGGKVLGVVAGFALLAIAMCVLIVVVLRRELEQPMRTLARFTTHLAPEDLTKPLGPLRPPRAWQDEIDLVASGFRTLQDGIHAHVATLDAQVAIRTAQLEAALEENRVLTLTDALTGCYNRRYLDTRLAEEVRRARRTSRALGVVIVDIDHFKRINDTFGHMAGDAVLRALPGIFRAGVRQGVDWVARFGGEEFVLVLPDTPLEAAEAIAGRLREQVEGAHFAHAGGPLRVTASFGVAMLGYGQDDAEALLRRADAMLYRAKAQGRNRVVTADRAMT